MMNLEEKQILREIVQEYKRLESQLVEIEKIQEALKIKVKAIMENLEENRNIEFSVLEELNKKYGRVFTVNELMTILND